MFIKRKPGQRSGLITTPAQAVRNILVDGAYNAERFEAMVFQKLGATVEVVKRNALQQVCCHRQALGCRALFCLAGKVPPALEELRTQTAYQ